MLDASPGDGVCETDVTGDCTLRAAVQEANALEGADTITIPAGEYNLTMEGAGEEDTLSGDLDITDTVTITGAGMGKTVIDANELDRAFQVFASLDLSELTIINGFASPGGAVLVNASASITRVAWYYDRVQETMKCELPRGKRCSQRGRSALCRTSRNLFC